MYSCSRIFYRMLLTVVTPQTTRKAILLAFSLFPVFVSFAADSTATGGTNSMDGDVLDHLIGVTIILFILSVITEKLTQLIRKYSPFIRPGMRLHGKKVSRVWRNIRKKQIDGTRMDNKIEREVNSLSFVIGLLIATIFCVDLFHMFVAASPADYLYWTQARSDFYFEEYKWGYRLPLLLVSFSLTGFFLTFGSKFFHDLLDSLFQAKNLKRKLVDENTFTADSIEQFDEFLDKTFSDLIGAAISQNRNLLEVSDAVSPPMHGRMRLNGKLVDCIDIHLKGNDRGNLPQIVPVKLGSGRTVTVRVNAILGVDKPSVSVLQGDTAANQLTSGFKGTICCKVMRDGVESLLTCSHVVTGGTADNLLGSTVAKPAQIAGTDNGNFIFGLCTDEFDIALLSPDTTDFAYVIHPKKERRPALTDILHTRVRVVCRGKAIKKGIVVNDRVLQPVEIEYKGNISHSLINLIVLSDVSEINGTTVYSRVVVPGDSGGCVYDESDMPIGMIVASNNKFSYAIPIVSILNKLSATIIK
jgi:hypothetical protein